MYILAISIFVSVFLGMLLKKYHDMMIKALLITVIAMLVITGGIAWKNRTITIDSNNVIVQAIDSAAIGGSHAMKEVFDSMEAAAQDTISGKERLKQINAVMRVVRSVTEPIRGKTIYTTVPYLSDLYRGSCARRKEYIEEVNYAEKHYNENLASAYRSIQRISSDEDTPREEKKAVEPEEKEAW